MQPSRLFMSANDSIELRNFACKIAITRFVCITFCCISGAFEFRFSSLLLHFTAGLSSDSPHLHHKNILFISF